MIRHSQPAARTENSAHPLALRLVAVLLMLVMAAMSSVQSSHVHGDRLTGHQPPAADSSDGTPGPGSEAACPLCVAMHSALPQEAGQAALLTVTVTSRYALAQGFAVARPLPFSLFSRPPPARCKAA